MRELATVQQIKAIHPIKDADFVELAQVMGWQCVVKKGEFQLGDYGVYFEIDSYLPLEGRYEFLRKSCYRNNDFMGEGLRIKTMRFRGELSQGLFLPLANFPEIAPNATVGDNVTELLNIRKWDIPEVAQAGTDTRMGHKPHGIPTTDEIRIQSAEALLTALNGHAYYITTKMDGTSCTIYHKSGECGVCGRNYEYADDEHSSMWSFAHKRGVIEKLKALGRNIAIQGEFCGGGIQKNKLRLKEPDLFVFDVVDLDNLRYLGLDEIKDIASKLGLEIAPVEEEGENFDYSLEQLLEKARGKYPSGVNKEGIGGRSKENIGKFNSRISFKAINNDFLLKEED